MNDLIFKIAIAVLALAMGVLIVSAIVNIIGVVSR